MRRAILVDLDGTLALCHTVRNPYATEECEKDPCNEVIRDLMSLYAEAGYAIICITGRHYRFMAHTMRWLTAHKVTWDALYMRVDDDQRPVGEVKAEVYHTFIKNRYAVAFVLEDHTSSVRMWRALGLTCFQVAETEF